MMGSTLVWLVVGIFLALVFGIGIVYYVYKLLIDDNQVKWKANVYAASEATYNTIKDKDGKDVEVGELSDLVPIGKDELVRETKEFGVTIFKLRKYGKTTGEVKANNITTWKENQEVDVLIDGDNATLLTKGYNKGISKLIFNPMPRERMDMLSQQVIVKKEKLHRQQKNIWEMLSPYFAIVMAFIITMGTIFFAINGYQESIKEFSKSIKDSNNAQLKVTETMRMALSDFYTGLGTCAMNLTIKKQTQNMSYEELTNGQIESIE